MKSNLLFLFFIMVSLMVGNFSIAQNLKLTQEEFLKRTLSGDFRFEKNPLFALPQEVQNSLMEKYKSLYPSFQTAYWYVPTVRSNQYFYTLFYDWVNRKCLYRLEEIDLKTKKSKMETVDPVGKEVDTKYCEKAYDIKIN